MEPAVRTSGLTERGLPATYVWLVLGAVVASLVALPVWTRRDIGARS